MATRPQDRIPGKPALPGPPDVTLPPSDPLDIDFASQMEADAAIEDYEHLLEDFSHLDPPAHGELLRGHVLKVTAKEVIVDVGLKSEGVVPIEQFQSANGAVSIARGDEIDVMMERGGLTPEGFIPLSHKRAVQAQAWDNLERAQAENLVVSGRVVSRTRGGVMVDVGTEAFMPTSHLDIRPVHNLDEWVGQDVPVRVVKVNRRRGNVVVSRRMAIEEEYTARKDALLGSISEGSVLTGVVKNLMDYGVFVDLGGIDGLLHVSDMSHGRVGHPSELMQAGDTITVKVLKFDRGKQRISLGTKQLAPDPWETISERYPIGNRIIGNVVSVTDYGAFVEIEPGVEGLIHISEMTWSRRMKHPSKVTKPGDQIEAVVLDLKPGERRVSLGIKQLEADPWTTVGERYAVGSVVEGRVRKLTDFGAFLEIEEGIDGLIHISDFSWTKRIKHPSELLRKGQIVQTAILGIDTGQRRLSLGIKQLQPDAWESFFNEHMVNDIVQGKVKRAAQFGLFVELAPGVEGLCHNSEIPGAGQGRDSGQPAIAVGTELDFKIIRMNEAEKRIGLSVAAIASDAERSRLQQYRQRADAVSSSVESLIDGLDEDSGDRL